MKTRLAYLFERFPTFTQTFCFREVRELERLGTPPLIYSIRNPQDEPPQDYPPEFSQRVRYLPEDDELVSLVKAWHSEKKIPREMRHTLQNWPGKLDKHRVYAAAVIGPELRKAGIRHVHVHFAGIAARTAYWLKKFYGISYSFTGHANDIFCTEEPDIPVTLADLMREARFVATVSNFSRQFLIEKFPEAADKVFRVYNGIDLNQWPAGNAGNGFEEAKPGILSVGRYIPKKGFLFLIEACRILQERGGVFECKLVGEGPMEAELQAKINQYGLADTVKLTGPKSQLEIASMMRASRVFALACVHEEDGGKDNLPTVIMEAMASGLPIVSTRLAGVPEMILPDQTGIIQENADPAPLADALAQYLNSPELAQKQGAAGRQFAEQEFALPHTTTQLLDYFIQKAKIPPTLAQIKQNWRRLPAYLFGTSS